MADNYFDQFDSPAATESASKGNYFDQFDEKPAARSAARSAGDSAIAAGTGVIQGVKMLTDVAGADNAVSRTLGNASDALTDLESPYRKAQKQERAAKIKAAEATGSTWEEIKAHVGAFADAPLDTTLNALGTSAPTLAAAALSGGSSVAAQIAARAAPVVLGVAQGAGNIKGQVHEAVKQKHLEAGVSEAEATQRADAAQAYDGSNLGSIALGGALGGLAGGTGAEAAARRLLGRKVAAEAAEHAAPGVIRSAVTGAAKEAPMEALQGGQERHASNVALQGEGFDVPTWQGVAGQAALEGLAAAPMGGGFGVAEGMHARGRQTSDPISEGVAARQAAEAAAADAQAKADAAVPPWTTDLGAADPNAQAATAAATDANAPRVAEAQFETQPGAAPDYGNGIDYQREFDTGGMELAEGEPRALGFNPLAGTPTVFADGSVALNGEQEFQHRTGVASPSQRMGLDARTGSLSAAAVQAVDSGAHAQMQQAAAQVQAAQEAKRAKPTQKKEQEPQAMPDVDPQTGEIAQGPGMAAWSDADLSTAFRGAQSRDVRLQLAKEMQRRREQRALQAELDAEQSGTVPGADGTDTAFASVTEDAGALPARAATTTEGQMNGAQADQAQQAAAQPPQGRAAPAGQPAARGLSDGAPAQDVGAQAAPAAGPQAQAQGGEVEALRQKLRDVEARIIAAAPGAMGQGGGDIEAAMKSRKVPVTLKAQRKKLVDQVRTAQATEVKTFAPETGTLGIPRADMPQVPSQSHGGLVKHLNAQGIAHEIMTVDAAELKPTQAEYSPAKVEAAKTAGGDRAVIVSNDGHIIDGHHQAMAAAQEGKPVKAIVLDAPVDQALEAVKASPSAQASKPETPDYEAQVAEMLDPASPRTSVTIAAGHEVPESVYRAQTSLRAAPGYTMKPGKDGTVILTSTGKKSETSRKASNGEPPASPSARIEDFGETLRGARKMLYAEAYADGMAKAKELDAKAHPLSKTWPDPDYAKLLEGGAAPEAVALVRALRDAVPTKPQSSWKLKGWTQKMQALRGFAEDILAGRAEAAAVTRELERAGISDVANQAALYEAVGHDRSLKGVILSKGLYSMYDGVRHDPPRTIWTVAREAKASALGNWPRELAKGDTREAAIAAFKQRAAELLAEEQAPARGATFEIYGKRAGGARAFFIGKKIGRNVAELKGGFADLKTARQYKADHQAELEDLLAKYKAVPPVRNAQNAPRIGQDYRKGADVTPEQFQEAFGFRGVQFGNYVEGGRRQHDLNRAYDALMDLAGVLELPPRALSLGGRLGLAFGARGSGGVDAAAAHYERGEVVINLTKRQGAGSLAHEWWHGLDNYFSRQRGDGVGMMTEESRRGDGVREEMRAAFRDVVSAINRTGMQERSRKLDDRRTKEYWTTKPEMSARAFESYVIAKLQDQSAGNDYLANVVGDGAFALEGAYPYPTAGELPQIREAFDAFFQTVETRRGEDGAEVLFRRDAAAPFDYDAMQRVVLGKAPGFSAVAREQAVSSVRGTVDVIRAAWGSNAPEVVVAFDMQDTAVPEAARQADLRQRSGGARGAPEGFYYRGKAYLMASRLNTPADATRVLLHEVLGHHGLRGKFGKDLDNILNQIATMRKDEVAAKVQEYGLRGVQGLNVREAAEEVLAEMAEKNPQLHFVRRAVAAIRNWLRAHVPGFKNLRLTDDDIIQAYILPARGWVERGGREQAAGGPHDRVVNFARHPGFSAAVDAAVKAGTMGETGGRAHIEIGTLSPALAAAGIPAGDLKTSAKVLQKVVFDHGVPPSVVKRIPELLERPVMVFHSATVEGSFVAVTSEMVRGAPLIVAISPETTTGGVSLNFVPSLYPRDDLQAIQRWLNATKPGEQLLTYLDKEQSPAWFGSTRLQLPGEFRTTQGLQSRNIATQADVVNAAGGEGDIPMFSRSRMAELKDGALAQIDAALSHPGKVSLWDKTVGTMRHLAERAPAFKPVFESAQRQIDDVAMLANDAADVAPRLLPRVDKLRDLAKRPISAEDNKAVARPLFEGTLLWGRDLDGQPALADDLQKKYANLGADEKAQLLLRAGRIDPGVLAMWRGMPLAQFEAAVSSRFESKVIKAGVVWEPRELRAMFGLNDQQMGLYQEARGAIDRSIDMTARADMLRSLGEKYTPMRAATLEAPSLTDALTLLVETLEQEAQATPDAREHLADLMHGLRQRYDKARELMAQGYAPLSRFGRYTLDVVDARGERLYFGMYESMADSNRAKIQMASAFPGATVSQGTMSAEAYKLFAGITPESLELFGNMLGLDAEGNKAQDKAFQQYLQLTKNNHSALKRLIHRKGIAGYSDDVGRVLASFIYSNARQAAAGLNAGVMDSAINAIPKEQGELRDVAMGLRSYIQDPQEEGQAVRGMLFAQYLGGSVASAFVNTTQPFAVTLPWLSQFGGMKKAGTQLARALKDMGTRGFQYQSDLAHALKQAEDDGIVSPQEIHQLMAQARGAGALRVGDGTRRGNARAAAANAWERTKVAWGQPFALAEQFNRRSTFIAAYRLAQQQGMDKPAEFARRAVLETQFLYSKANKPRWARGAVGGTLFTFKTYSVSYLELMQRMWTQGGPEGKRAVGWAVAMLLLMSGAGGLPFMEDLEDLIDGAGQLMGYNVSAKQWRKQVLRDVLGKELADFVEQGVSGLPGAPVDVSGRLGMGNLIPGTGLLMTKQSRERDLLEVAGPAGDLVARGFSGARKLITGDVAGAALEVAPTAVRNAAKGADMASSGMYKDTKGYKVIDTTLDEALAKAIGFQPRSVAEVQEANSFMQRSKSFYTQTSSDIKAQWAQALFEKDGAALERVRRRLEAWNRDNPEQRIVVRMPDVWKRVREMGKDRTQRIAAAAPKALRQQMREMAREAG
ncbi:PLxRFG domain-containing protein [Alicycliphilus denitrificans]|uniref:PLxRFG domain-containing protein n=1 Tax=Alicycliphilus denitrificans TaxID=179636 RepID=UPI0001DA01F7|nr:PLxRFG domain-containing protein [Alicycliphilus denitrificans]ADU99446.1 hypothetical protein Alide_1691 [Alicycliphilus denitrificans BC]